MPESVAAGALWMDVLFMEVEGCPSGRFGDVVSSIE